jgi:hypothetical protein
MVRGFAAAKVVVVQGGEIIVDQRISVNKFERAADVHRAILIRSKHPRSFHAKNRANPLATGENAVAHGAMDGRRERVLRRQKLLQSRFHRGAIVLEKVGYGH